MRIEKAVSTGVEQMVVVQLIDPGAGQLIFLDPLSKIAHRIKTALGAVPDAAQQSISLLGMAGPDAGGSITQELIGTREIAGVTAEGVRIHVTKSGVASPVAERWVWRELGLVVLTTVQEEGRTVIARAVDVRRGPPPPELFEIPEGYTEAGASPDAP